jgi:hypothetical protein
MIRSRNASRFISKNTINIPIRMKPYLPDVQRVRAASAHTESARQQTVTQIEKYSAAALFILP